LGIFRLTLDTTKSGQNRLEGVFGGRNHGTRGPGKELESLCAFHSGCVSHGAMFCVRSGVTEYLFRGRTQVEAGSTTVLGIGPGKSPVVSGKVLLIILHIPAQHQ
jgi:hypothetical protein